MPRITGHIDCKMLTHFREARLRGLHSAHLDRAFSAFIVRLDWGSRSASIRVARDAEQIEHLSLQHG